MFMIHIVAGLAIILFAGVASCEDVLGAAKGAFAVFSIGRYYRVGRDR